ncbi:hypothetical protein IT568_08865 [bacterium]|nr:hypothetical protein [bacterium]
MFLPIFAYAEIHYRFKYFFSYLKTNEPEIIADAPYRTEPGKKIPLLILVKDANRFPITLEKISVKMTCGKKAKVIIFFVDKKISSQFWEQIFELEPLGKGNNFLDVTFFWKNRNNKAKTAKNDNYKGVSHEPLTVFVAEEPLPKLPGLFFGETHFHTNLTSDQVEFGASPESSKTLAKAIGIDFCTTTDHSYDLDDTWENYLENSETLPKWEFLQAETDRLNAQNDGFVVVRGEELTCRNSQNQNVHLLVYGNTKFYKGSGDSAEKWFQTFSEFSVSEVLQNLEKQTVTFAAHSGCPAPLLEKLLINRGEWLEKDHFAEGLNGVQILNGELDKVFEKGKERWINALLSGKKLSVIAGNDAHGNFNRFRQVGFPFFKMREGNFQLFGKSKTIVKLVSKPAEQSILEAMKNGKVGLSTGVLADFEFVTVRGIFTFGDTASELSGVVFIRSKSSAEFGKITEIKVVTGNFSLKRENVFRLFRPDCFDFETSFDFTFQDDYFRLEGETEKGEIFILTPIFKSSQR